MFSLPNIQYSMSDHANSIADMIEAKVEDLVDRMNESASSKLVELFKMINSKISANLALIEIMIYGSMSVSIIEGNYCLPKAWTSQSLGVSSITMVNRSLSAAYANRDITALAYDASTYFKGYRQDHAMDIYVCPGEKLKY